MMFFEFNIISDNKSKGLSYITFHSLNKFRNDTLLCRCKMVIRSFVIFHSAFKEVEKAEKMFFF